MKKILLVLAIFLMFPFLTEAKELDLVPTLESETTIKNDQITVKIGLKGSLINRFETNLAYNINYLELVDFNSLVLGSSSHKNIKQEHNFQIVKINGELLESKDEVYIATLTFKLRKSFTSGKKTDVFMYNNYGFTENTKYFNTGYVFNIHRTSDEFVLVKNQVIDKVVKYKYKIINNYKYILIVVIGFIGFILIILLIPRFKKNKNISKKIAEEIKQSENNDKIEKLNLDLKYYSDEKTPCEVKFDTNPFDDININDDLDLPKKKEDI